MSLGRESWKKLSVSIDRSQRGGSGYLLEVCGAAASDGESQNSLALYSSSTTATNTGAAASAAAAAAAITIATAATAAEVERQFNQDDRHL